MSIRSLRGRLERLEARAGPRYVIGQDRDRDRKRREELRRFKLSPGLTEAETAELAALDASFESEDRDIRRKRELFYREKFRLGGPALTDAERIEYAELRERYPPNPNPPFGDLAARLRAIAGDTAADGPHKKFDGERERAAADREECVTSQATRAAATDRPVPRAAEKPASPDLMTDAELLEQLLLAANHNVVPGEGIEDVSPVRVMFESGIELDDVLYALRCKVDRRAYPGNRALTSWSEHRFVLAVAEEYGSRVMLPVIKEKLKARGKPAYARASAKTACDDDGRTE